MQWGPIFGAVAVTITGLTTNLVLLGGTRVLEGAATAASVPSILGFLAAVTAHDEGLRGRTSARFELATIVGIGAGTLAATLLYQFIGTLAFFLNALIYVGSFLIYRFGVTAPDKPAGPHHAPDLPSLGHHLRVLGKILPVFEHHRVGVSPEDLLTQVLLEAAHHRENDDQLLAGGLSPIEIFLGLIAAGAVFFGGLIYWGNRFKTTRRTTIIFYGIAGGAVLVVGGLLFNHAGGIEPLFRSPFALIAGVGLFVLAGATPAALGLLADMSEAYPDDRGAVMGLYSVFLAVGQIVGALVGGYAAEHAAIDGLLIATLVLMAIAIVPLYFLGRERQFAL